MARRPEGKEREMRRRGRSAYQRPSATTIAWWGSAHAAAMAPQGRSWRGRAVGRMYTSTRMANLALIWGGFLPGCRSSDVGCEAAVPSPPSARPGVSSPRWQREATQQEQRPWQRCSTSRRRGSSELSTGERRSSRAIASTEP